MLTSQSTSCRSAGKHGSSRPVLHAVRQFRPHGQCRTVQLLVRASADDDSTGGDALDEPFLNKMDMGVVFSQQHSKPQFAAGLSCEC
jgi:hypothetical protein